MDEMIEFLSMTEAQRQGRRRGDQGGDELSDVLNARQTQLVGWIHRANALRLAGAPGSFEEYAGRAARRSITHDLEELHELQCLSEEEG